MCKLHVVLKNYGRVNEYRSISMANLIAIMLLVVLQQHEHTSVYLIMILVPFLA